MREIRQILGDMDYEILSMKEAGVVPDVDELLPVPEPPAVPVPLSEPVAAVPSVFPLSVVSEFPSVLAVSSVETSAVAANDAVTVSVFPSLLISFAVEAAPETVTVASDEKQYPSLAVRTMVAVYTVPA